MSESLFSMGVKDTSPEGTITVTTDAEAPTVNEMAVAQARTTEAEGEQPAEMVELTWSNGEKYDFDEVEGFDPSKYESVTDVIKHNISLRKRVSEKPETLIPQAPEEYEVDTERFNIEDDFLSKFTEKAKKAGLSQDAYQEFLDLAYEQAENEEQAAAQAEKDWKVKQLEKLGPEPDKRWNKLTEWADKQGMPEEMKDRLAANVKSADDVMLWEWALNKNLYSQPPGRNVKPASHNVVSKESLAKAMQDSRFKSDPGFQNHVNEMALQLAKLKKTG